MNVGLNVTFLLWLLLLPVLTAAQECQSKLVSALGTPVTFDVLPGEHYEIKVSGTFKAGGGILSDAKYSSFNQGPWLENRTSANTFSQSGISLRLGNVTPAWGPYNESHNYSITQRASSNKFTFTIYDTSYSDGNGGSLSVSVCQRKLSNNCGRKIIDGVGFPLTISTVPGRLYSVTAQGVYFLGDDLWADAKYSNRGNTEIWTDTLSHYEQYGPTLADLLVNGESVNWGEFNFMHLYSILYQSKSSEISFSLYDFAPLNNTGSLSLSVCPFLMTDNEVIGELNKACALTSSTSTDCSCTRATLSSLMEEGLIEYPTYDSYLTQCIDQVWRKKSEASYQSGFSAGVNSVDLTQVKEQSYSSGYVAGVASIDQEALAKTSYNQGFIAGVSSIDQEAIRSEGFILGVASIDQEKLKTEGYNSGYTAGVASIDQEQLKTDSYKTGYTAGVASINQSKLKEEAYAVGFTDGKSSIDIEGITTSSYHTGYTEGFSAGTASIDQQAIYSSGFQEGVNSINQEQIKSDAYSSGYIGGMASIDQVAIRSEGYTQGYLEGKNSVDLEGTSTRSYNEGYLAGVDSVDQEVLRQEGYLEGYQAGQASAPVCEGKVQICHLAGESGKGQTIEISRSAVQAHLHHGDYEGECQEKESNSSASTKKGNKKS